MLKANAAAIIAGISVGTLVSLGSALALALALHLTQEQYATLLPKSVTTAISMDVAAELGGIAALTGAIVILTGIAGNLTTKQADAALPVMSFNLDKILRHNLWITRVWRTKAVFKVPCKRNCTYTSLCQLFKTLKAAVYHTAILNCKHTRDQALLLIFHHVVKTICLTNNILVSRKGILHQTDSL